MATRTKPPEPRRKRRSADELRARVLEAAEREFSAQGFAGATTAAITEAQIFRLYPSKAALFREAIFHPLNRHFADFHARMAENAGPPVGRRELARRYIDELQDFIHDHARMLMTLIVANAYGADSAEGPADIPGLAAYFDSGAAMHRTHNGDAGIEPQLMVRVSFAAVLANVLFRDWLFPKGLASDAAIREAIARFTIEGVGASWD
jgi:AcrR family transcriptional regulator